MERLTDSELIVMKCIWDTDGQITLAGILKIAKDRHYKKWKLQTISTFIIKLVQKGYIQPVNRERYEYCVLIPEIEYMKRMILDYAEFWGEGVSKVLLATLVEKKITPDQACEIIRRLIEKQE